jgi:hypothetical protein
MFSNYGSLSVELADRVDMYEKIILSRLLWPISRDCPRIHLKELKM